VKTKVIVATLNSGFFQSCVIERFDFRTHHIEAINASRRTGPAQFVVSGVKMSSPQPPKYPLLEEVLALRQMALQPMYTIRDVAALFGVTVRSIQARVASGQVASRDLPGRAKFLPVDLEDFLRNSQKKRGG